MNGYGIMTYAPTETNPFNKSSVYKGNWQGGLRHGEGVMVKVIESGLHNIDL
jgi:hypothetical protein